MKLYPAKYVNSPSRTKYVLVDFIRSSLALNADIAVLVYSEVVDIVKVCGSSN